MSGFDVVQEDLRSAAHSIDAAGAGVGDADPSRRIGEVGGAMPGSSSGPAAQALAGTWRKRFDDWASDAEAQATRLRDSATEYDNGDYLADQRLRVLMHRMGESAY